MPRRARWYMGSWVMSSPSTRMAPGIRADQPHDDVERGGFARPVGPQQAHHLALLHVHRDVVHHRAARDRSWRSSWFRVRSCRLFLASDDAGIARVRWARHSQQPIIVSEVGQFKPFRSCRKPSRPAWLLRRFGVQDHLLVGRVVLGCARLCRCACGPLTVSTICTAPSANALSRRESRRPRPDRRAAPGFHVAAPRVSACTPPV